MGYICDRCGKKIPADGRYYVRIWRKDTIPLKSHLNCTPEEWDGMELCEGCKARLVRLAFARPAVPNQEFEAAVKEMVNAGGAGPGTKRTNLDRIWEMPVEELVKVLSKSHSCENYCALGGSICDGNCTKWVTEWLNQEVKE